MKKWIVWLKKNSPWIFLLIGPVLNFYLLEWYTHNPFQTMKPYIQGMNLALFEFAALFLFALTGRISRALGIETRLLRHLRSCKLFRPGISRRAHPAVGHSFDLDCCQRRGQLRIQIEPHRSNRADLFCPASGSGIFPEKRLSEKK